MFITGLVVLGAVFGGIILFLRYGLDRSQIDRLWASGTSFFNVMKTLLPSFYLYICLPPCISASVTIALVRKRFFDLKVGAFLLSVIGVVFLFAYLLLSLFDTLFSGLELGMQAIFVMLALMMPGMLFGWVLTRTKVNTYLRKAGI